MRFELPPIWDAGMRICGYASMSNQIYMCFECKSARLK